MKISHKSPRNTQIFHKDIKLLLIRNKKLYRGRLKAKTPVRRLKDAVYQFFGDGLLNKSFSSVLLTALSIVVSFF